VFPQPKSNDVHRGPVLRPATDLVAKAAGILIQALSKKRIQVATVLIHAGDKQDGRAVSEKP
jgi:hypothetical protein